MTNDVGQMLCSVIKWHNGLPGSSFSRKGFIELLLKLTII